MERLSCAEVRPFRDAFQEAGKGDVLNRVKVMQEGDVNDSRPFTVDAETLSQIADLGNGRSKGIRSRVTHPNMCNDGMGCHLGRAQNFRVEGDSVYADLHFAESAKTSPKGDYVTYIQTLAEEDPEALGMSVVVEFTDDMEAELETHRGPDRVPMRVSRLRAVDVVDEPAATRGGMFGESTQLDIEKLEDPEFAALVTQTLETRFKGLSAVEVSAKIAEFLTKHYGENPVSDTEKTTNAEPATEPVESNEGHVRFIEQFGDKGATMFLDGKTFEECLQAQVVELQAELAGLKESNAELQSKLDAALLASGGDPAEPIAPSPEPEPLSEEEKKQQQREAESAEFKSKGINETDGRWAKAFAKRAG